MQDKDGDQYLVKSNSGGNESNKFIFRAVSGLSNVFTISPYLEPGKYITDEFSIADNASDPGTNFTIVYSEGWYNIQNQYGANLRDDGGGTWLWFDDSATDGISWRFTEIGTYTGINNTFDETISVLGDYGKISLASSDAKPFIIYDTMGQQVASGIVSGRQEVALLPGLYVVTVNETATKVLVK